MQKLIIQPCSSPVARENYKYTIEDRVLLDDIKSYLDKKQIQEIPASFPDGKLQVWGVVDGNKGQHHAKWKTINIGDVVVFTWNKAVRSRAVIAGKLLSNQISQKLWHNPNYRNIYLLSEVENIEIPYSRFSKLLGYNTDYNYQGFLVLPGEKSVAALEFFDIGQASYADVSETEFENAVNKLYSATSLDRETAGYQREEQGFLRTKLFGKKCEAKCAICGNIYPVDLLIAAHIKRRADCTLDERKDFKNIVMPACKFGCDDLYEKGYILVQGGKIAINSKKWISSSILPYLSKIEGRICEKWNEATAKYFEAHNHKFGR